MNRPTVPPLPTAAEKVLGALCAVEFPRLLIEGGAIRQQVRPPCESHLRVTEKARDRGQRLVQTVVASTRLIGTTIVYQLPVRIRSRICADQEMIAIPQGVLHRMLIRRMLQRFEITVLIAVPLLEITVSRGCVGFGDVVAQLSQIVPAQPMTAGIRRQSEMVPQLLGEVLVRHVRMTRPLGPADVETDVGFGRICGVLEVDQNPVTGQQLILAVELEIGCLLRSFPYIPRLGRGYIAVPSHVHLDPGHSDRVAAPIRETPEIVGGPTISPVSGRDLRDTVALGALLPERLPSPTGPIRKLLRG
jgi:hypothetical protein